MALLSADFSTTESYIDFYNIIFNQAESWLHAMGKLDIHECFKNRY